MIKPQLVIFSDLDGTFLGHQDYGYAALHKAVAVIQERNIPLVFCSSKTRAEIEALCREIGNRHPFIVENGGAVFWLEEYFQEVGHGSRRLGNYHVHELGTPRTELLRVLRRIRSEMGTPLRSFADMTTAELAESSGLSLAQARLAMEREYDEPFEILTRDHAAIEQVVARIIKAGLHCTRGGRYWHILGDNDKGKACRLLLRHFGRKYASVVSAGFGDSANDLPLLQAVDFPVLVKRIDGTYDSTITDSIVRITLADGVGPVGWASAVGPLLAGFG